MMYQLKRSGKFENLAGLIIGGFSDMKDTTVPFGQEVFEIINDITRLYKFPVCFNFPVSHERANYALKIGIEYTLNVNDKQVSLMEN